MPTERVPGMGFAFGLKPALVNLAGTTRYKGSWVRSYTCAIIRACVEMNCAFPPLWGDPPLVASASGAIHTSVSVHCANRSRSASISGRRAHWLNLSRPTETRPLLKDEPE